MLHVLFAGSPAFAEDPVESEGIVQVPAGTSITVPGKKPFTVSEMSFLLPEPYYDEALMQAKELRIFQPALERCTTTALEWIGVSEKALTMCSDQFNVDAKAVETLRISVQEEQQKRLVAEARLRDVRVQRNTAWAITGGLILGSATVIVVAIAP